MAINRSRPAIRPPALIFDVDGTLCDVTAIRHLVDRSHASSRRRRFNRFHSESIDSPAYKQVVSLLQAARDAGFAIVIVTAREEKWSFLTSKWLSENRIEYDELFMRSRGDFRSDSLVKSDMERDIARKFDALLAVDDRADILEVWQKANISTVHVVEGELGPIEWRRDPEPRIETLFLS